MPFNVQDFRSRLQFDGARPNLFDVQLAFPPLVGTGGTAPSTYGTAQEQMTFRARASSLPGDTVSSVGVNYFGREIKVAGNRTFPDWSFTVINDEDFTIRTAFERWMSGINSHVQNLRAPEFIQGDGGYQSDAFVTQYGKTGDILKRYRIVGAFPADMSPIELDWSANDSIEEFTVTLAYQWWETLDSTDSSTSTSLFQQY
jgi:hypothetical protein